MGHRASIAVALAALALAGCTNADGAADRRGAGGLVGAVTGAAAGNLIGGDGRGTLLGASAGALLGAAIGNDLDRQAQELEASLAGSGAAVVNTGSQLVVRLPAAITFATGSAELREGLGAELAEVAQSLQAFPDTTVEVIGHTDDVGRADFNQRLSERRARAVADALVASGTPAWRILTRGRGSDEPIASNDTEAGRAANRRVEIVITPNT